MRGLVTKYFADRAFGFIKPDGSRTDFFSIRQRWPAAPCLRSIWSSNLWKN
jgi:hypothetical protein